MGPLPVPYAAAFSKGQLLECSGSDPEPLGSLLPAVLTLGTFGAHLCNSSSLVRKPWPLGFCNQDRSITNILPEQQAHRLSSPTPSLAGTHQVLPVQLQQDCTCSRVPGWPIAARASCFELGWDLKGTGWGLNPKPTSCCRQIHWQS